MFKSCSLIAVIVAGNSQPGAGGLDPALHALQESGEVLCVAWNNHVVEQVGPHPGFLAEAVECENPSSLKPAENIAASWLFVFFLVNHFENLNSMET